MRWSSRSRSASAGATETAFWKRSGESPYRGSPACATGSNYDDCAEWLAAVFELDSAAYQRVVRGWAGPHARRKNLWLAITRRQLPL